MLTLFWDDPSCLKYVRSVIRHWHGNEALDDSSTLAQIPTGGHHGANLTPKDLPSQDISIRTVTFSSNGPIFKVNGHRVNTTLEERTTLVVPDLQTFPKINKCPCDVKHATLKQALRGAPILSVIPDWEDSHLSFIRISHPQLHFGIRYPKAYSYVMERNKRCGRDIPLRKTRCVQTRASMLRKVFVSDISLEERSR
ncbi:hypothetical protein Tco_0825625 [Tanacetum coccineum]